MELGNVGSFLIAIPAIGFVIVAALIGLAISE